MRCGDAAAFSNWGSDHVFPAAVGDQRGDFLLGEHFADRWDGRRQPRCGLCDGGAGGVHGPQPAPHGPVRAPSAAGHQCPGNGPLKPGVSGLLLQWKAAGVARVSLAPGVHCVVFRRDGPGALAVFGRNLPSARARLCLLVGYAGELVRKSFILLT